MSFRLFCTLFLLVSVCAFPVFFTIGIGLFSIVWFRDYYEAIPLAFLNDAVYGLPMERFFSFPYIMTLVAAVLVLSSVVIRRHVLDTSVQKI
jgi:hypothetical protein